MVFSVNGIARAARIVSQHHHHHHHHPYSQQQEAFVNWSKRYLSMAAKTAKKKKITMKDGENKKSALYESLIAAGILASMVYYVDRNNYRIPPRMMMMMAPKVTLCEPPNPSTSFQVMAALEMKDEVQRIRLAQILHDLHEVAKEGRNLQRQRTVRRLWKYVSKPFSGSEEEKNTTTVEEGQISLLNQDFSHMTPEKAQTLIDALFRGGRFAVHTIINILGAANDVLLQDDTLVDLRKREKPSVVTVVGDLHGSLSALQKVLKLIGKIGVADDNDEEHIVVFDGDFVDRGDESLEVLLTLLLLKLAHPQHVYLVRGNHEDVLVASAYGFHDEVVSKYGVSAAEMIWYGVNDVFCALPIAVATKTAAILHGGLPWKDFMLEDLARVTVEERCSVKSAIEPQTDVGHLIQGILWSDPMPLKGVRPNSTRTVGVFFGPDVVHAFLERHGLRYLIRGHEVAERGTNVMDCGHGHSVVTVFSQPSYPNGGGHNLGAVVRLDKEGKYKSVSFRESRIDMQEQKKDPHTETLREVIEKHRFKLEDMFQVAAPNGKISHQDWVKVMAETLELPEVPWMVLIPSMVPKNCQRTKGMIDWKRYLESFRGKNDGKAMEELRSNHQMLVTVFKFLDFDGDGVITVSEFKKGAQLLNKRLPKERHLKDIEELFRRIDADGSGAIDLDEFSQFFDAL